MAADPASAVRITTDEMLEVVRLWAAWRYAGKVPKRFRLDFYGDDSAILPMPAAGPDLSPPPPPAEVEAQKFVPNDFQDRILDALAGKAMRTDALGNAVDDRRRLFAKKGSLTELIAEGWVKHHKRVGYYRPDDPPAELAEE